MASVAAGNQEAFAELFDSRSPLVLGVLVRMLGQNGEAEEVLQEVFLQAWMEAERYRPYDSSVTSWLLLLARSRGIDRIRRRESRSRRELADHTNRTLEICLDPSRQTHDRLQVGRALDQLSVSQRTCIELAYYLGLSHSEIAARLALPLGTVKSRIKLGVQRLQESCDRPLAAPAQS
jgi:RNA polymerase sigma-70 factor (ECF subfamily)